MCEDIVYRIHEAGKIKDKQKEKNAIHFISPAARLKDSIHIVLDAVYKTGYLNAFRHFVAG